MSKESQTDEGSVPLAEVSTFVRQLAHDLHNDLNALELGVTYISELVEEETIKSELTSQQETIHRISQVLHTLALRLQPPEPETLRVTTVELIGEFRDYLSRSHPEELALLTWSDAVETRTLEVDFRMICNVLTELFENALHYREDGGRVTFKATVENERLSLQFSEKTSGSPEKLERLGQDPFLGVGRRSYGLGLFYANRVARVHGGSLETRYADGLFSVTLGLPLVD